MFRVLALCLATVATIHQVSAADAETQKIVVEFKPVIDPEMLDALQELIPRAVDALRRSDFGNPWLTSSVAGGEWCTVTFKNGYFGVRVFSEAEKEQLDDTIPKDLRTSDMFQVMEVRPSFIRVKSKELELIIPATRISFIARGVSGDLPH